MYHCLSPSIMPLLLVPPLSMSVPKIIGSFLSPKMEPRIDNRDICITRKMVSVKLLRCPMEFFLWTACYRFMLKSGMMEQLTYQNTCLVAKGYTKIFGQDYIDKVPGFKDFCFSFLSTTATHH